MVGRTAHMAVLLSLLVVMTCAYGEEVVRATHAEPIVWDEPREVSVDSHVAKVTHVDAASPPPQSQHVRLYGRDDAWVRWGVRRVLAVDAAVRDIWHRTVSAVIVPVQGCLPPTIRDMLGYFLHGAASVALVGQGITAIAAGGIPEDANTTSARQAAVWGYTTGKFLVTVGAVTAESLLLACLHHPPHRNEERNAWNRFFASWLGWPLLVTIVAVPNGLLELSLVLIMLLHLSTAVYMPAVTLGHLLRPYLVALIRTTPALRRRYEQFGWWSGMSFAGKDGSSSDGTGPNVWLQFFLFVTLLAGVGLLAAPRLAREPYTARDDEAAARGVSSTRCEGE